LRVFARKVCAKFGAVAINALRSTLIYVRADVAQKILSHEGKKERASPLVSVLRREDARLPDMFSGCNIHERDMPLSQAL